MIPEKIGRYEIKSELGRGGMATVYKAHDPSSGREVAVKVLPREFLHDPQFRARFEREIKTVAQLEHPAIVPIYDVGEDDGQPFFVMRNMTGGSLSDWLKQGAFSPQDTARIIERLAKALAYAHKKGIVHRDLKPGNVLFDSSGDAFLSDFGVAKLVESASVTGSGVIGTPAYMSPEQAQSGKIDSRSDIYAMGAIIYEMLSGQQPYRADTPMGVVVKHITDPVPQILRDNPALSPELDEVIRTSMDKDPNKRYPTMLELAKALNKAAFGIEGNAASDSSTLLPPRVRDANATGSLTMPSTTKKSNIWVIAGVILIVLIVAGTLFLRGTPASTPTDAGVEPTSAVAASAVPATDLPPTTAPSTATEAATILPTHTLEPLPTFPGGADLMALIAAKEIVVMNMDGSQARILSKTGSPKTNLQWLEDGKSLVFVTDNCAYKLDIESSGIEKIICFQKISFFEGFQISPDGTRVAIGLNRELVVVPFNPVILSTAQTRGDLMKIEGACLYNLAAVKDARWSNDGTRLAVTYLDVNNRSSDAIRILDITHCATSIPLTLDEIPGNKFVIRGFQGNPTLPSFDWDGDSFLLFNDYVRNNGYGNLYYYDLTTHEGGIFNPIEGTCCYRDARFSPDGKFVAFLFQDQRLGENAKTVLYYVSIDLLQDGQWGEPIAAPNSIFSNLKEAPIPALRPALPPP